MARCLTALGGLPEKLVWDREGALCSGDGRPTDAYAAFCGQLPAGWVFCRPRDAEAKGAVERLQQYMESSFEPGRQFANEADFQAQLDAGEGEGRAPRPRRTLRQSCRRETREMVVGVRGRVFRRRGAGAGRDRFWRQGHHEDLDDDQNGDHDDQREPGKAHDDHLYHVDEAEVVALKRADGGRR
jgi:hypothetical protein